MVVDFTKERWFAPITIAISDKKQRMFTCSILQETDHFLSAQLSVKLLKCATLI